jgi:uncharacterized protein YkwD
MSLFVARIRLAALLVSPLIAAAVAQPVLAGRADRAWGGSRGGTELAVQSSLDTAILQRINEVRTLRGLSRLAPSSGLQDAASLHTRQMAETGRFSHDSPDGSPFWRRVQRFYPSSGFDRWNVGENLLWSSPGTTAANVVSAWLASPPHRKILLDPKWRQVGIAAGHDPDAPGDFFDQQVTIVTADFGSRSN